MTEDKCQEYAKNSKKLNTTETNNLILELGYGVIEIAHGVEGYGLVPSNHNGHFRTIGSPCFGRPDIFIHFMQVPAQIHRCTNTRTK